MAARDVIISAFATPPESKYRTVVQNMSWFDEAPLVINVEPDMKAGEVLASAGFQRTADKYFQRGAGSILGPLLAERAKGTEVRSVTLIGFSAGNSFLSRVLATKDWQNIDGVISLDGMAFAQKDWIGDGAFISQSVDPWLRFATSAAQNKRLFVDAYTHIASHGGTVGSTALSADHLIASIVANLGGKSPFPLPIETADLVDFGATFPVTQTAHRPKAGGGSTLIERTWPSMPEPKRVGIGNAWFLDYGGKTEVDHIFIARYAQAAIWKTFLAPRLNGGEMCAFPMSGLGAVCNSNRALLPPGTYPTPSAWPPRVALLAGVALGVAIHSVVIGD